MSTPLLRGPCGYRLTVDQDADGIWVATCCGRRDCALGVSGDLGEAIQQWDHECSQIIAETDPDTAASLGVVR